MDELEACLGELDEAVLVTSSIEAEKGAEFESEQQRDITSEAFEDDVSADACCLWNATVFPPPWFAISHCMSSAASPPSLELELQRLKAVRGLWGWLSRETRRQGLDLHVPSFERWLLGARHYQWQAEHPECPSLQPIGGTDDGEGKKRKIESSTRGVKDGKKRRKQEKLESIASSGGWESDAAGVNDEFSAILSHSNQRRPWVDPLIPRRPGLDEPAAVLLGKELVEAGATATQALLLIQELNTRTATAAASIRTARDSMAGHANAAFRPVAVTITRASSSTSSSSSPSSSSVPSSSTRSSYGDGTSGENGVQEKLEAENMNSYDGATATLQCRSARAIINRAHLDKLRQLHRRSMHLFSRSSTLVSSSSSSSSYASSTKDTAALNIRGKNFSPSRHYVDHAILTLLLRYNALSGGAKDGSGGGFQGALHEALFDTLRRRLGCSFECFASPINCHFHAHCSAFPDTDGAFGSCGSFFDKDSFWPDEGCFEANPPFVPLIMDHMVAHMDLLLRRAQRKGKSLSFIVVIPYWSEEQQKGRGQNEGDEAQEDIDDDDNDDDDEGGGGGGGQSKNAGQRKGKRDERRRRVQKHKTKRVAVPFASGPSWRALQSSPFLKKHLLLKAQDHGYCEGSQHVRPTRYKTSRFASSLFLLRTEMADRSGGTVTKGLVRELRSAFGSRFDAEVAIRKTVAT